MPRFKIHYWRVTECAQIINADDREQAREKWLAKKAPHHGKPVSFRFDEIKWIEPLEGEIERFCPLKIAGPGFPPTVAPPYRPASAEIEVAEKRLPIKKPEGA